MTDELTRLKEAAEKVIEAEKEVESRRRPGGFKNVFLHQDHTKAMKRFHEAATPELILSLITRIEGAEEALKPFAEVMETLPDDRLVNTDHPDVIEQTKKLFGRAVGKLAIRDFRYAADVLQTKPTTERKTP